jgi:hypothetical protein
MVRFRYLLIVLVLLGLGIRLYAPMTNDFLVNYDSIYHARIGQIVAETGWVPEFDTVAGGRPHLYPPAYHLVLGYTSLVSGVPVLELVKFILPLISSLLVFTVFFYLRRFRHVEVALLGALIVALNPLLVSQSYDSPQMFVYLLFPLIAYFFLKRQYYPASGLLAISLLFNYMSSMTVIVVLLAFALFRYKRDKGFLINAGLTIVIGLGLVSPWLLVSAVRSGECIDPVTAVVKLTEGASLDLIIVAPFLTLLSIALLYYSRGKDDDYIVFWKVALSVGTIAFLLSIVFPQLHPYDQILLFGFSLTFVLAEVGNTKIARKILPIAAVLMLAGCLVIVSMTGPKVGKGDLEAIEWFKEKVKSGEIKDATILANTENSGILNLLIGPGIRTEFDLFLECIPDTERWVESYTALETSNRGLMENMLKKNGIDYILVGERDKYHYGFDVDKFKEMEIVFSSKGTSIYKTNLS